MSMSMISHQNAGSVPQKPKNFCRAASSSPPRVPKSRSFTGDFLDIMIHDLLAGEWIMRESTKFTTASTKFTKASHIMIWFPGKSLANPFHPFPARVRTQAYVFLEEQTPKCLIRDLLVGLIKGVSILEHWMLMSWLFLGLPRIHFWAQWLDQEPHIPGSQVPSEERSSSLHVYFLLKRTHQTDRLQWLKFGEKVRKWPAQFWWSLEFLKFSGKMYGILKEKTDW